MPTRKANRVQRVTNRSTSRKVTKRSKGILASGTRQERQAKSKPERVYRPSALNWPLFAKDPFQFAGRGEMGSENLVGLLPEIYQILLKLPEFKDNKVWETRPTLPELAIYLFDELRKAIPKGFTWALASDEEYSKLYYYKAHPEEDKDLFYCPLEWTEKLKVKQHELRDLVVMVLAWVQKFSGTRFIYTKYNDYFLNDWKAFMEDQDEYELALVRTDIAKYNKGGVAYRFYHECKRALTTYSKEKVISKVNAYRPKGRLEMDILTWLRYGITLFDLKATIDDFSLAFMDLERNDGDPILPSDTLCFQWSFHDTVFENEESWINDTYSNVGNAEPVVYGTVTPKKHILPKPIEELIRLRKFFLMGNTLYDNHYRTEFVQYYDNRRIS